MISKRPGPYGICVALIFLLACPLPYAGPLSFQERPGPQAASTTWEVRSSIVLEAVCFLNPLVGDPFYLRYFQQDYDVFAEKFTPEVRAALTEIKAFKERKKVILSAFISLFFQDRVWGTLDELVASVDTPADIYDLTEAEYQSLAPHLKTVFSFLRDSGFEEYWNRRCRPTVEAKIAEFEKIISTINIIPPISEILGRPVGFERQTLFVIHFTKPHGIGLNQYTVVQPDVSSQTVLQTAIHEFLHAFQPPSGSPFEEILYALREDEFMMERFRTHNPSFGYNTFEGYIEENVVRALDQVVTEEFGIPKKPWRRFIVEDGGMHVLAAALYILFIEEGFSGDGESFDRFYIRMASEGKIGPGKIKPLYERYRDRGKREDPLFYLRLSLRSWAPYLGCLILLIAAGGGFRFYLKKYRARLSGDN